MRFIRQNPELNDAIEALDRPFSLAKGDVSAAWKIVMQDATAASFIRNEIRKCDESTRYFLENYFAIISLQGDARTLYPLWDSQEMFLERVEPKIKSKERCFIMVDKARQQGISNVTQGTVFKKVLFTERCNALVIAHVPSSAENLLAMSKRAYEQLPWWMRPEAAGEARRYMFFERKKPEDNITDPGLNSRIWVDAANKEGGVAGISFSIRVLHLSEISSFADPDTLTDGIFPTLNYPDELAIIESTGRTRRNFFYRFWKEVESNPEAFEWDLLFVPDYAVSYHFVKLAPGERIELTKAELLITKRAKEEYNFSVPEGYFKWRRAEILQYLAVKGSDDKFYQEHPTTVEESFIATGLGAYPRARLREIELEDCRPPERVGEISLADDDMTPILTLAPYDKQHNYPKSDTPGTRLSVWEEPQSGREYYLGADCAMGIEGGDYSCIQIFKLPVKCEPTEQVAEWHGWIGTRQFGRVIAALGYWYNTCEIAPEANDVGREVIGTLNHELNYPNWYVWRVPDKRRNTMTNFLGWKTQANTRGSIISNGIDAIVQRWCILHSLPLLEEMMDFSDDGEGRIEGDDGHDDRVFAKLIALYCSKQYTIGRGNQGMGQAPKPVEQTSQIPSVPPPMTVTPNDILDLIKAGKSGKPIPPQVFLAPVHMLSAKEDDIMRRARAGVPAFVEKTAGDDWNRGNFN